MSHTILVIDDEQSLLSMLKEILERKGYSVLTAISGKEALLLLNNHIDLIILDVHMPEMDGFTLCETIRNHLNCPIIFLTARTGESDKLRGLAIGGDDYIEKPFSTPEFLARIQAHLRRETRHNSSKTRIFANGLVIDYNGKELFFHDTPIPLLRKEYGIIAYLSLYPGQIFDKEQIYQAVWGNEGTGDNTVVAEHLRRARVKIKNLLGEDPIETVWGIGYQWRS